MFSNKKIIVIPDTHGKRFWEDALSIDADEYVFLGNYLDSDYKSDESIIKNFKNIINTAKSKAFNGRVVLLIGSCELQYFMLPSSFLNYYQCDSYRQSYHDEIYKLYSDNESLFKIAHQCQNYLFTHAGVTNLWYDSYRDKLRKNTPSKNKNIAMLLNNTFKTKTEYVLFENGIFPDGVNFNLSGPIYVKEEFSSIDPLYGMHQIVGGTSVSDILKIQINSNTSITYCNCLSSKKKISKVSYHCKPIFYEINLRNNK